jgi:hypothetical protein
MPDASAVVDALCAPAPRHLRRCEGCSPSPARPLRLIICCDEQAHLFFFLLLFGLFTLCKSQWDEGFLFFYCCDRRASRDRKV